MRVRKLILALLLLCFAQAIFASGMTENIRKGVGYLNRNRLDDAMSYFEREKESDSQNALAWFYIANVYLKKGNFAKAQENLQKAVDIEPNNGIFHSSLAYVYLVQGLNDKALEEFNTVIKVAPGTLESKLARRQIEQINQKKADDQIIKQWHSGDLALKSTSTTEKKVESVAMPESGPQVRPVPDLIKDLKFGTLSKRKDSSRALYYAPKSQIEKVLPDITALISKEKDSEVRKNLLLTIGKIGSQDAGTYLLAFIDSPSQSFDLKLVALQAITGVANVEVAERLKDTLDNLVNRRIQLRAEAERKIKEIKAQLDDLDTRKLVIAGEIEKLQQTIATLTQKLGVEAAPGATMPGFAPGMVPPGMPGVAPVPATTTAGPAAEKKALSEDEIKEIKSKIRDAEQESAKKRKQIEDLDAKKPDLEQQLAKYENILARKKAASVSLGGGASVAPAPGAGAPVPPGMPGMAPGMAPGMPPTPGMAPGMAPAGMPAQPQTVALTPEEEQEQVFALNIIMTLGKIGKPDYLPVIERAWDEYGTADLTLRYGLVRARLKSYDYLDRLIERLREDYASTSSEEIELRTGIVEVLGDYLSANENDEYAEMLNYLMQNDPNEAVRTAARAAVGKIKKKEAPAAAENEKKA